MSGDCAGCGMPRDDWTPGCQTCVSRHYKAAVRSGDPDMLRRHRAISQAHIDAAVQERAQQQRDGLLEPWWLEQPRAGGRWVTA